MMTWKQIKRGMIAIALVICLSMAGQGMSAGAFASPAKDTGDRPGFSAGELQASAAAVPLGREWRKAINKKKHGYYNIAELANGNIVAVGETSLSGKAYRSQFAVACFDRNGKQLWERTYNKNSTENSGSSRFTGVAPDPNGGFVAAGDTTADKGALASNAGVLAGFDDQGNVKWVRQFKKYIFTRVAASGDGGFTAIGSVSRPKEKDDLTVLVKVDAGGNVLWDRTSPQTNRGVCTDLILCADGGFTALGGTDLDDLASNYTFLIKFDKNGNRKWIKTYKKSGRLKLVSLVQLPDGMFVAAGATTGELSMRDGVLVKFNASGALLWKKSFGGLLDDLFVTVTKTKDGNLMVFGTSSSIDGAFQGSFPRAVKEKNAAGDASWNYFPKACVMKFTTSGKIIWTTTMDPFCFEETNAIALKEGGYIFLESLVIPPDSTALYPAGISKIPEDLPQVAPIRDYVWTGKLIKPFPVVRYQGRALKRNVDYTLSWKNNKKTGFASVTMTGKGSVFGKRTIYFRIKPVKTAGLTIKTGAKQMTLVWKKAPAGTVQAYFVRYRVKGGIKWNYDGTENASGNTLTIKKLRSGKSYEVQVCGVSNVSSIFMMNFGDWSVKKTSGKVK